MLHLVASLATSVVDLTLPFAQGDDYNANTAYAALMGALENPPIATENPATAFSLLHEGKVIADYYGNVPTTLSVGAPPFGPTDIPVSFIYPGLIPGPSTSSSRFNMFSVTKSWSSLLVGCLVKAGKLSPDDTLGEIFTLSDTEWLQVESATEKKAITLESLISFTSGLKNRAGFSPQNPGPQETLIDVLNNAVYLGPGESCSSSSSTDCFLESGDWSYLGWTNLLAYVINETAGVPPQEYAQSAECPVWASFGVDAASEIVWEENAEGVANGTAGLTQMTVPTMLKFGQLYLQNGQTNDMGGRLISEEWVEESQTQSVFFPPGLNTAFASGYGYQFWQYTSFAGVVFYAAIGAFGQAIAIYPTLDMVLAVTTVSSTDPSGLSALNLMLSIATPGPPAPICPDACTGNPIETCFYDPTCSSTGAGWEGGLGCNAGGQGQDCRFCGFGNFAACPGSPAPIDPICPVTCTESTNPIETCYYDPACSDPSSIDYVDGFGCNAGGQGQNCRFCGFTNPGDETFLDCPALCPDVCAGPGETCFYDPTCNDAGAGWKGGLGCNAGGRAQECRFCGFQANGNDEAYMDCPVCDLGAMAGDPAYSCGARISWLEGIGITPTFAADAVAAEFPTICGACRATQFPAPAPGCAEGAMAGAYTCKARIDWLMSPHGPGGGLSAAAAGAKVETEFPTTCQGCRYWYLSNAAMWAVGGAAALLLGAAGLVARKKLRKPKAPDSAAAGPELSGVSEMSEQL